LYNISKYVNGRLPKNLQIDRPTGHSGRHTFISNAINSGVAPEVVAKASKHKDVNCVQKYFHETTSTKLLPALSLIGIVSEGSSFERGVDEDLSTGSKLDEKVNDSCSSYVNTTSCQSVVPADSTMSRDSCRELMIPKKTKKCVDRNDSDEDDVFVAPTKKQKFSFSFCFE
jgi:hypothetical protein